MTVGSQVKQCTSMLKSIEQGLLNLLMRTQGEEVQTIFKDAVYTLKEIIADLEKRVGQLESEEPQYKGL
ncbi:MAG TPA: DUF1657 domain-containing protein [Bacillus bacterium]|nr:DUF1657 domain-containing protein [Bacillus sp. (in: firmicutes)]